MQGMPKRRPATRRMELKDFLVLLNTPNRNANPERVLQKTRSALEWALEPPASTLKKELRDELKRILGIALNQSRAKGFHDGLCEGWRLQSFKSRIDRDPARRYLTNRIRSFPEATGEGKDKELCAYMDRQIKRLVTLKNKRIEDGELPLPPKSWGTHSWVTALKTRPSVVSKYISGARETVLSDDYTFLLAWERIRKGAPSGISKSVDHRNLHLDKIDWERGRRTHTSSPAAKQMSSTGKSQSATAGGAL